MLLVYMQANAIEPTTEWRLYAFYNPTMKNKLHIALHKEIQKTIGKRFISEEFENKVKNLDVQKSKYCNGEVFRFKKISDCKYWWFY